MWGDLKWILETPWLGSLLGVIGLLSLPASYVFYRLSKRRRLLSWACDSVSLIDAPKGNSGDIQVMFHGNAVNRVTRTRIAIWNSGTEALRKSDLVSTDSLRFEFATDVTILRVQEIRMTKAANAVTLPQNAALAHVLSLAFEFLDHNDGAIFEVLHTGPVKAPVIRGVIVDLTAPIQFSLGSTAPRRHKIAWGVAALLLLAGALGIVESVTGIRIGGVFPNLIDDETRVLVGRVFEFLLALALWIGAYFVLLFTRPVIPASLLLPTRP